jgi:SAM-dependent methyltransferase
MPGKFPKRNYEPRPRRERGERPARGDAPPPRRAAVPATPTAWNQQAGWYDRLHGDEGDDFYRELILPTVLRRLGAKAGERVLDVCCGQGVLGRALAAAGIASVGVDASPQLVEAAKGRAGALENHLVGDCRELGKVLAEAQLPLPLDHAALVMALQDLDPIAPVLAGVAAALRPGGRVVVAMTHPAFRIPRRSSWGWDENQGVQFRRLDGYLSPLTAPIRTHPGQKSDTSGTTTFHRPLSSYLNALGAAGLGVVAADELCSHRRGTKGPRFGAEDRAAKEFPLFLVLTAARI